MNSIDIVYKKYRQGLKNIRDEHSEFFAACDFTIFDCYTFQYVAGTEENFAEADYYHGRKYHKLLPEIRIKAEAFIKELFEWVADQRFDC
jgi:hypothetical protein